MEKCFIIHLTNGAQYGATCHDSSQVIKLKMLLLQDPMCFTVVV